MMFEPRSRGFSEPLLDQSFCGWLCALQPGDFFGARPLPAVERGLGWGQGGPPLAARPRHETPPRSHHFQNLISLIPRRLPRLTHRNPGAPPYFLSGDIESRRDARSQPAASRFLSTPGTTRPPARGYSYTNNQTNAISPNPSGIKRQLPIDQRRSRGLPPAGQGRRLWPATRKFSSWGLHQTPLEVFCGVRSQRAASRLLSTPGGGPTPNNQTNPISPNPSGINGFQE